MDKIDQIKEILHHQIEWYKAHTIDFSLGRSGIDSSDLVLQRFGRLPPKGLIEVLRILSE